MRTLLIDGDVVAYQAASAAEVATDWGDGYWTWHCDENGVRSVILNSLDRTMDLLSGHSYKLCLTDSIGNFRKAILPTYKGNRSSIKKPLVLKAIRQWMIDDLGAYFRPGLEGDDCMGILATVKGKDERVIVSIDKDMKSVPGLYCRDPSTGEIISISEDEADYWHLFQTLTGDTTDGYKGCPGIGPVKAEAVLEGKVGFDAWEAVVDTYVRAGQSAHEALIQARVARILRASDYDFQNRTPILWTP